MQRVWKRAKAILPGARMSEHITINPEAKHLPVKLDSQDADDLFFAQLPHQRAPLPVPNPTKSFWTHGAPGCNPLAREGSEGHLPEEADVVIIGSGITGVSTAYHLSRLVEENDVLNAEREAGGRALRVIILEAREFCSGATGRNGGHLTPGLYARAHELSGLYGAEEATKNFAIEGHTVSELLKVIHENNWEKDVDLVEGGHIQLIFSDKELHDVTKDVECARAAGVEGIDKLKWLSKEAVKEKFGTLHPAVQIPGWNLWPLRLMTKLFLLARGESSQTSEKSAPLRLSLHTQTPVHSVQYSPIPELGTASKRDRRWTVKTPRGNIRSNYVVHATNAYASHLLPHLAGPEHGIVPSRGQVVATEAIVSRSKLWSGTLPGWGGNDGYEYWFARPTSDENQHPLVILGGGRETAVPGYEYNISDDSELNTMVSETLRNFLPAAFVGQFDPEVQPRMEWTGIMGFTKSHDPMVGVADASDGAGPGQYIAAGYSGHGMPRAFACAEAVAQLIAADLSGRKWMPPVWLPRWYLRPGTLSE